MKLIWLLLLPTTAFSWQTMPMGQTPIIDPVLNMAAFTISAPAGWKVSGAMVPNPSCAMGGPMPAMQAIAPDGLSGVFIPPRYDWAWGVGVINRGDCLPTQQVISARDFLTYFIRIKQLGFVQELPVAELEAQQRDAQKLNRPGFTVTMDEARFLVRYQIGAQVIDERITAMISCNEMAYPAGARHNCNSLIIRMFAPSGQFEAMLPALRSVKPTLNQQWSEEWNAAMVRHVKQLAQVQNNAMMAQNQQAQAARRRQHQEFMASMQRGRDLRNQQFRQGQYVKTQNKEDYVDYLLDCHRLTSGGYTTNIGNCGNRETTPR